jgi:hypothetical protein
MKLFLNLNQDKGKLKECGTVKPNAEEKNKQTNSLYRF